MGFEKKKKICHIRFNASDTPARAFQDCGMFLYTLAKDFNWESTYVFYKNIYMNMMLSCYFIMAVRLGN